MGEDRDYKWEVGGLQSAGYDTSMHLLNPIFRFWTLLLSIWLCHDRAKCLEPIWQCFLRSSNSFILSELQANLPQLPW